MSEDKFEEIAKKYDNIASLAMADKMVSSILEHANFDKEKTKLMDFGCGTGLLSMQLVTHVKSIYAVDISESMLGVFKHKASSAGVLDKQITIDTVDVTDPAVQAKLAGKFDAIISGLAFHHIEDVQAITDALATFLAPGGKIYIIDTCGHERNIHGDVEPEAGRAEGVYHPDGFTKEQMEKLFTHAGLKNYSSSKMTIETFAPDYMMKDHSCKTGETRVVDGVNQFFTITDLQLSIGEK